ncbi:MAG: PAS domain S-box-containing protein [Sulfurimonas sp.]|uniref:HD domain-containing phosphohydrolase n=1 Tax=Sulfurimonas sp. TaxID=2022749 RepID=UPI0039E6ED30
MTTINHFFISQKQFSRFIKDSTIDVSQEHFVQVFIGNNNPEKLKLTLQQIKTILPYASIIATSTAGEILEGGMQENTTVVSISTFKSTKVSVHLLEGKSEQEMADTLFSNFISSKTKLILVFNNVYNNDGENFIEAIARHNPNINIAGGNAGDNGKFSFQTIVGADINVSTSAIGVAIFDSDILQVFNEYLFNWQDIGETMTVTKSENSIIHEIDNKKAQDVYREFLGDDVADNLPSSAVEFPLVFTQDKMSIARSPVAVGQSGSLVMAGHMREGSKVKFGFGDLALNALNVKTSIENFSKLPIESIFIYSCSARKYFFKNHLNHEFEMLQKIAPTSGFITYGEFFKHNQYNKMLNVSSTFIGLSEDTDVKHSLDFHSLDQDASTRTLSALTHLIKTTSKHVEEKNNSLKQLEHLIKGTTLYSATDPKGIITDVNQRFVDLSKYSKEELIGNPHNIVRHSNMPSKIYEDMWKTIQSKKHWSGIIKNKSKDGKNYFVKSNIFPILDINNEIIKYVSIRDDITEEMQRKELLEGTIDYLEKQTETKSYLLDQYEKTINLSTSFFRIDKDFKIIHSNDIFAALFQKTPLDLLDKNISEILEPQFLYKEFDHMYALLQRTATWSGIVPFKREDDSIIYADISINTIFNQDKTIEEFMIVLHDITDLINIQQEIEDTQKDIVYTMGAIGESRSKETGHHVKRVAEYSKVLALHYGLDETTAELLKMASPMHDIGKIGIPDSILNKPGKLTDDEWKIMKSHSVLGYSMLKSSKREILQTAAIVSYTHHEQWDGNGYPKGLKGEDIHIFGRITAIADVFDALGSDRCYKKAWNDEKIFQLIKDGRGKHFDPKLVDIFFQNLNIFLKIRSQFKI